MLLTRILATLALVASTFANPFATTNSPSLDFDHGPTIKSGYSSQEREQIRQAHLDAVKLVHTTISNAGKAQYDRIFSTLTIISSFGMRDGDTDSPSLVVCPRGFKHGSFLGKVWPDVWEVTCDSISPRVSWQILTLSHFFVQQYTFFQKIERSALNALGGTTFDLANGPIDVLNIDRYEARVNADSYAWFVTELAWTIQCGRYFEPPMAGDDDDPN